MPSEAVYQAGLIKRLQNVFPGCHVLKNDPARNQGIPDLLVLVKDRWMMLEVKKSEKEPTQPNQEHYIDEFNKTGFAAIIYPENEEQVIDDLRRTLG